MSHSPTGLGDQQIGDVDLCVVDVETTGFRKVDRIIEVAVRRVRADGTVVGEYETLVNPGRSATDTTHIHGITDRHLVGAPAFEEVAGDLAEVLDRSVWVAHNASFDFRFLSQEYSWLGDQVPQWPLLCTMRLSPCMGGPSQPTLESCHSYFGSTSYEPHRAQGDVEATTEVALRMLSPLSDRPFAALETCSGQEWNLPAPHLETHCQRTGRRLTRDTVTPDLSFEAVVQQGSGTDESGLDLYRGAVEAALDDRLLDAHEVDGLIALGARLGISAEQAISINRSYFEGVAARALADNRIDDAEARDLSQVAEILCLEAALIDRLMASASASEAPEEDLAGKAVCFTGGVPLTRNGRPLSRADLQAAAQGRGMVIKSGVSKKLDLLVTSDPHSMSGKSKKARELGIRIVALESFIGDLGIEVD